MRFIILTFLLLLTFSFFPAQVGRSEAVYPPAMQRSQLPVQPRKVQKRKRPRPPKEPRKAIQFAALGLYLSIAGGAMFVLFFFFDILLLIYLPLILFMAVLSSIFIMLAVIRLMGTAYKNFKHYNQQAAVYILLFICTRLAFTGIIWYAAGPLAGIFVLLFLLPALIIYFISIVVGIGNHISQKEEDELLGVED